MMKVQSCSSVCTACTHISQILTLSLHSFHYILLRRASCFFTTQC